jgi:hypothetical protein
MGARLDRKSADFPPKKPDFGATIGHFVPKFQKVRVDSIGLIKLW